MAPIVTEAQVVIGKTSRQKDIGIGPLHGLLEETLFLVERKDVPVCYKKNDLETAYYAFSLISPLFPRSLIENIANLLGVGVAVRYLRELYSFLIPQMRALDRTYRSAIERNTVKIESLKDCIVNDKTEFARLVSCFVNSEQEGFTPVITNNRGIVLPPVQTVYISREHNGLCINQVDIPVVYPERDFVITKASISVREFSEILRMLDSDFGIQLARGGIPYDSTFHLDCTNDSFEIRENKDGIFTKIYIGDSNDTLSEFGVGVFQAIDSA